MRVHGIRRTIQCVVIGSGIRGVEGLTIEVLNTEQTPRSGDPIKHTCLTTPVTPHLSLCSYLSKGALSACKSLRKIRKLIYK